MQGKVVIQTYADGQLETVEAPSPQLRDGWILVRNAKSVISAGTEKTKVDTARKSLVGKARARPDLLRQVLEKAKREGLWSTWQTVTQRLQEPMAMGYACAGEVIEVSGDVGDLRPGDRVACGGGTANHAEIVAVPKQLAVRIPSGWGSVIVAAHLVDLVPPCHVEWPKCSNTHTCVLLSTKS
jgi:polar amino acid transport system substrate-binding protein